MKTIAEKTKEIQASPQDVFAFLSDLNNLDSIVPKERIKNFQSTTDTCAFNIEGMADISMKVGSRNEFDSIELVSDGKNPFEFKMMLRLEDLGTGSTNVTIRFDGDVNTFMKMMIEKPLGNFLEMLGDNLKTHFLNA